MVEDILKEMAPRGMSDYCIMLVVLAFLGFTLLYNAKLKDNNENFFDIKNTMVMRGFWCLVIILVHVPEMYQNRIQDMIGSFAYIGVTFFFMTSAYGLTISQDKYPDGLRCFWRKRLPKLLIVPWLIHIITGLANVFLFHSEISFYGIFVPDLWIMWLISAYFIFWITNYIFNEKMIWKSFTILSIVIGSLIMYYLQKKGVVISTTWCTECYGFIWGILLASVKTDFVFHSINGWRRKWIISVIVSAVLGVCYLKFKNIPVYGDYILKIVLGVSITIFILVTNTRIDLGNKVGLFLGKISLEIYLLHGTAFTILGRIYNWKSSGIFILVSILLTVILSIIVHIISDMIIKVVENYLLVSNKFQ